VGEVTAGELRERLDDFGDHLEVFVEVDGARLAVDEVHGLNTAGATSVVLFLEEAS
jgi:hypothetical protein